MASIDIAILAVLLLSAVVSFVRGFFKEAMSLVIWIVAVVVTLTFTARFATWLPTESVDSPTARASIAAFILFVGTMIAGTFLNFLLRKSMSGTTLGATDRIVGVLFGLARGGIIVAVLVLFANLAPAIKQEPWWRASVLLPRFQLVARAIHERLPDALGQHFEFGADGSRA